jgi:hypothetical protein
MHVSCEDVSLDDTLVDMGENDDDDTNDEEIIIMEPLDIPFYELSEEMMYLMKNKRDNMLDKDTFKD